MNLEEISIVGRCCELSAFKNQILTSRVILNHHAKFKVCFLAYLSNFCNNSVGM